MNSFFKYSYLFENKPKPSLKVLLYYIWSAIFRYLLTIICFFVICVTYNLDSPWFPQDTYGVRMAQFWHIWDWVLAVVVTVQVQLSIPDFTAAHLQPHLLTIPLCGHWDVQLLEYWLCIDVYYHSTSLWIRTSILTYGQFPRMCAGH